MNILDKKLKDISAKELRDWMNSLEKDSDNYIVGEKFGKKLGRIQEKIYKTKVTLVLPPMKMTTECCQAKVKNGKISVIPYVSDNFDDVEEALGENRSKVEKAITEAYKKEFKKLEDEAQKCVDILVKDYGKNKADALEMVRIFIDEEI